MAPRPTRGPRQAPSMSVVNTARRTSDVRLSSPGCGFSLDRLPFMVRRVGADVEALRLSRTSSAVVCCALCIYRGLQTGSVAVRKKGKLMRQRCGYCFLWPPGGSTQLLSGG